MQNNHNLALAQIVESLESISSILSNGKRKPAVTSGEKRALVAAIDVLKRLQMLCILNWTSSWLPQNPETKGKLPPDVDYSESFTALFFSDSVQDQDVVKLIASGEILNDPRIIVTTPEKLHTFLGNFGLPPSHYISSPVNNSTAQTGACSD